MQGKAEIVADVGNEHHPPRLKEGPSDETHHRYESGSVGRRIGGKDGQHPLHETPIEAGRALSVSRVPPPGARFARDDETCAADTAPRLFREARRTRAGARRLVGAPS